MVQKKMEEQRVREASQEAARIAAADRERLGLEREPERERAREALHWQAEAARRAQVQRRAPTEYPPGAAGWFMRVFEGIVPASANASSGSPYHYDNLERDMYRVPIPVGAPPHMLETATSPANVTGGDCAVSCDRVADTLLMTCKHLAVCGMCWGRMGRDKSGPEGVRCPFCRGVVTEMLTVFRN